MNTCRLTPDLVSVMTARKEMFKVTTSEEEIKNDALSHQPEMVFGSIRYKHSWEMTAPSSARPSLYSSSQTSAREDCWVVNGVSTTGTRWSYSWFWPPSLPTTDYFAKQMSPLSSTSAVTTSARRRQEDQDSPPEVADGGQARDGQQEEVLPGHRGEPLF